MLLEATKNNLVTESISHDFDSVTIRFIAVDISLKSERNTLNYENSMRLDPIGPASFILQ